MNAIFLCIRFRNFNYANVTANDCGYVLFRGVFDNTVKIYTELISVSNTLIFH